MANTRDLLASQASSNGYRLTITRHAHTDDKFTWAKAGAFCVAGLALPSPTEGLQTHSYVRFAKTGQAKPYMLPQDAIHPSTWGSHPMPCSPLLADRTHEPLTQAGFDALAVQWLMGLGPTSDPREMTAHPAYREIVGHGSAAIPFILRHLKQSPSLLAWALFDITGLNPVKPSDSGNLRKITNAWLKWGKMNKKF